MRIGLAGDWHGNAWHAKHCLEAFHRQGIDAVFQLGDFGIGWPGHGAAFAQYIDQVCDALGITLYVVPGNHENWEFIEQMDWNEGQAWLGNRICVLGRNLRFEMDGRSFLALGGAPSIDFPNRTRGVSWWPEEMLTLEDVEIAAAEGHVDVMLTHDAPAGGTSEVQRILDSDGRMWTPQGLAYAREGQELMKIAVDGVKPKVFAHGHFHVGGAREVDGTQFLSLDKDATPNGNQTIVRSVSKRSAVILDLPTLSWQWMEFELEPLVAR